MNNKIIKKDKSNSPMSRSDFIVKSSILAGSTMLLPRLVLGQECDLTTDDIMGPYFVEGAPIRTVIAHPDELGQRLFVGGTVFQNDCVTPISGAMIEVWHANDAGCYSINLECNTSNPDDDEYNLRGKMFSNENGLYAFETILPGNYASRPMHIHIKITTPDGQVLISQLYFSGDPLCEVDPWCQDADDRILALIENSSGLHGDMDFIMNSTVSGIIPGDVNLDGSVNVQDIVMTAGIILGNIQADDFQMYAADVNQDTEVDILDIVNMVNLILGNRRVYEPLQGGKLRIEGNSVSIATNGEIAGIQLFTQGNFNIKGQSLPNGWKLDYDNSIILIYNLGGGQHNPGKLFEYDGDLEIVSNIITGWDAQRLSADINSNPAEFHLGDPYPNPFNPAVNIQLNSFSSQKLKLAVYDVKGRELAVLFDGTLQSGKSGFTWNASIYPTGIYFIKAQTGGTESSGQVRVKKVNLLK